MTRTDKVKSRPGRPRSGESAERRASILDAALVELTESGYDKVTMLAVARRAGASKETLYNWFGNKDGLFAELIERNADESAARVQAALSGDAEPRGVLVGYAVGLLSLLTSPASLALNRAAMYSDELADVLLTHGRHRVGPLVETYLAQLADDGHLAIDRPADAFRQLYGLVVRDTQIRVLLGEPPPSKAAIRRHCQVAVDEFLLLNAPGTRQPDPLA